MCIFDKYIIYVCVCVIYIYIHTRIIYMKLNEYEAVGCTREGNDHPWPILGWFQIPLPKISKNQLLGHFTTSPGCSSLKRCNMRGWILFFVMFTRLLGICWICVDPYHISLHHHSKLPNHGQKGAPESHPAFPPSFSPRRGWGITHAKPKV